MDRGRDKRGGQTADTDHWRQRTALVGFDWAGNHNDVVLVDLYGKIVEASRVGTAHHTCSPAEQPPSTDVVTADGGWPRSKSSGWDLGERFETMNRVPHL